MDAYGFSGVLPKVRHCNLQHSDVILDGTNDIPWKLTIKQILNGICVFHHVVGISIAPSQSDIVVSCSETSALLVIFKQQLEKWATNDFTAKMIIS